MTYLLSSTACDDMDPRKEVCCAGIAILKKEKDCCGNATHGESYVSQGTVKCCDIKTYSAIDEKCCDNQVSGDVMRSEVPAQ